MMRVPVEGPIRSDGQRRVFDVLILFLVVFFFIYAIAFKILPAELYTARIIGFVAALVFVFKLIYQQGNVSLQADLLFVLGLYFAYWTWVAIRTVSSGAGDISIFVNASLFFVQVLPGAMLTAAWVRKDGLDFKELVLLLHAVVVVQGVLIVMTFVSWDFRLFTLDLLREAESNVNPFHPFRVSGLTHNTGAKLSAFQATGFFFTFYLFCRYSNGPVFWYLCISIPILLASILLTGRAGFVGFGIALVMAVWWLRIGPSRRGLIKGLALIPLVGLIGYLVLEGLYLWRGGREMAWGEDAFHSLIRWVVDEFSIYLEAGTLNAGTVGVLLREHWFLPPEDIVFLLGDPRTWAVQRIGSDIGVVRMIFGTGLIGTVLLYSAAVSLFIVAGRYLESRFDRSLVWSLFIWMAVFELKEPSVMDLRYFSLLAILMVYVVWSGPDTHMKRVGRHLSLSDRDTT